MAKYTITEVREIMTTWVGSDLNTTGWMQAAFEDNCTNLDSGQITESVFSASVQGMCRSLGAANPLSRRRSSFAYDETRQTALDECKTFTTAIETAFNELSPTAQTYFGAKISKARPTGIYANGADLAGWMQSKIENEAKTQQRADKKPSKTSAKGGNL